MELDQSPDLELNVLARRARRQLVAMHRRFPGPRLVRDLACIDALLTLHHRVMRRDDHCVLASGDAAGALHAALWSLRLLPDAQLQEITADRALLAGYAVPGWVTALPGTTAAPAKGFSLALDLAQARTVKTQRGRVYCLTTDGDWQDPAMWAVLARMREERPGNFSLMVAAHDLLVRPSTDVSALDELGSRLPLVADLLVVHVDGHDHLAVAAAAREHPGAIILLHTVPGRGVSFLEHGAEPPAPGLDANHYDLALRELDEGVHHHDGESEVWFAALPSNRMLPA